jgi:hypothetical protein
MESFFPEIWNVLHDGVIVALEGEVPGTLRIDVSIDYLRKRFDEAGESIQLSLYGCTRFAYQQSPASAFITDLPSIVLMRPEILNASLCGGLCEIECADGSIEVVAAGGSIRLDTGRNVELRELIEVADGYWTEWSERARQAREARRKPP